MEVRDIAWAVASLSVLLQPIAASRTQVADSIASGQIVGTVTDPVGQQLRGAFVLAIPQRGGMAIRTTAGSDGTYRLNGLADEPYRVDFWLPGFQGTRHNHVQPGLDTPTRVDSVLIVAPICECIQPPPASGTVDGRVVDEAGHPLPHALLEFVGATRHQRAWADENGAFRVSRPAAGSSSVVASDSGFPSVSQGVTSATTGPLVFRLGFDSAKELLDIESFNRDCDCPGYFHLLDARH